jgi:hypothetical protein
MRKWEAELDGSMHRCLFCNVWTNRYFVFMNIEPCAEFMRRLHFCSDRCVEAYKKEVNEW